METLKKSLVLFKSKIFLIQRENLYLENYRFVNDRTFVLNIIDVFLLKYLTFYIY